MKIQALSLLLTEQDLNDLSRKHLPADSPVEELRFQLTPEGVVVTGEYPLFVRVKFETLWELGVRDGRATARLARFKALGLPVSGMKNMILKLIGEAARKEDWLQFEEDTVLVHVEKLLQHQGGFPVQANLTALRCLEQHLVIEAGSNGRLP